MKFMIHCANSIVIIQLLNSCYAIADFQDDLEQKKPKVTDFVPVVEIYNKEKYPGLTYDSKKPPKGVEPRTYSGYSYSPPSFISDSRFLVGELDYCDKYAVTQGFPYGAEFGKFVRSGVVSFDTKSRKVYVFRVKHDKNKYNVRYYQPKSWTKNSCLIKVTVISRDAAKGETNSKNDLSWKWDFVTNRTQFLGYNIPDISSLVAALDGTQYEVKWEKAIPSVEGWDGNLTVYDKTKKTTFTFDTKNSIQKLINSKIEPHLPKDKVVDRSISNYEFQLGSDPHSLVVLTQPDFRMNRMTLSCHDLRNKMKLKWSLMEKDIEKFVKHKIEEVWVVSGDRGGKYVVLRVFGDPGKDDFALVVSAESGKIQNVIKKATFSTSTDELDMFLDFDINYCKSLESLLIFDENRTVTITSVITKKSKSFEVTAMKKLGEYDYRTLYGYDRESNMYTKGKFSRGVIYKYRYPYTKKPEKLFDFYKK